MQANQSKNRKLATTNEKELLIIQRDLAIALGNTSELNTALNICLDAILKIDEIDCAGIYLVDSETGDLYLAEFKNIPPWFLRLGAYYEKDSPQSRLVMEQKPIFSTYNKILDSLDLEAKEIVAKKKSGIKALGLIPIVYKRVVIGVLNVASKRLDNFEDFTKYALESIASQVGGIFTNIQTNETLKDSQNNLKTLFHNLNDFLFVLDESGKIIEFNPTVKNRLGYSEEELLSMTALDVHPQNRREEAKNIIEDMLAGKKDNCQIPLLTKDGKEISVQTVVTIGMWNHKAAIFGISRDITDFKKTEEVNKKALKEKETLLREIHHRVKNNMQIISSLLSLQANKSKDINTITALGEAESRIHSMTLVHEILYESQNISEIDFQLYIEKLIEHLINLFSANKNLIVLINAHNNTLRMEQVITCGLIITELISNCLKYAFNSDDFGLIKIDFKETDNIMQNKYRLCVCDTGNGFSKKIEWENSKTLGLRLVRELVRGQLVGNITLEPREQGISWVIEWND